MTTIRRRSDVSHRHPRDLMGDQQCCYGLSDARTRERDRRLGGIEDTQERRGAQRRNRDDSARKLDMHTSYRRVAWTDRRSTQETHGGDATETTYPVSASASKPAIAASTYRAVRVNVRGSSTFTDRSACTDARSAMMPPLNATWLRSERGPAHDVCFSVFWNALPCQDD